MRLTRRKDGPIKRSKRRGRGHLQSFKSVHKFLQRGGALEDLTFPLAKLNFLLSIYDDKPSIKAMLDRLQKVLEIGTTIAKKTVAELEAENQKLIVWKKVEVDWKSAEGVIDVAKQTAGLENIKRALLGDAIENTNDLAKGKMALHKDEKNSTGFEPNINNVAIAANDLFNTLLRGPTATAKRNDFLEHFESQAWECVDGTVDNIHAFILDERSAILLSKPVLDNYSKIIKKIVKGICEKQTYFKLEKEYFLHLLKEDKALKEYFRKYRDNEAVAVEIQKKVVNEKLEDIINRGQEIGDIITNLFNHSIVLSTISTVDIGTTTFVVGCVDETKAGSDEAFEKKVKEKEQTFGWVELLRSPSLLTKLNPVYSDTSITYSDFTTSKCRVSDLDIDGRTFTCDGDDTQKAVDSINSVTFSNPNPVVVGGGAPENVAEGAEVAPENVEDAAGDAPENAAPPE